MKSNSSLISNRKTRKIDLVFQSHSQKDIHSYKDYNMLTQVGNFPWSRKFFLENTEIQEREEDRILVLVLPCEDPGGGQTCASNHPCCSIMLPVLLHSLSWVNSVLNVGYSALKETTVKQCSDEEGEMWFIQLRWNLDRLTLMWTSPVLEKKHLMRVNVQRQKVGTGGTTPTLCMKMIILNQLWFDPVDWMRTSIS